MSGSVYYGARRSQRRTGGGAVGRVDAELDRIRRGLGDLPGSITRPARLRMMLQHLTKTLHPGVLSDCFCQPSTP
ncbi:hypothetical protein ACH4WW_00420 [Streptomyces halstedii]|uniref:hypothetical protein n=1 Tax=Streptomyces halstedii TaxID=1944 RepID=UPI00345F5B66